MNVKMNIMKKIVGIVLMLSLFSCDDWLDVESQKSVTQNDFFKNESEVEAWVNSIFIAEKAIDAGAITTPLGYVGLYCDDAGAYEDYRRWNPTFCLDDERIKDWSYDYNVIFLANMLEDSRSRFENVSEERADFWIAQANFAKAYAYFDLAREWGQAPITLNTESADPLPKSSVEEVLQEALRCARAALILPKHEQLKDSYGAIVTSKQYASLGTVYTLMANIYAWMGGLYDKNEYWQKADSMATVVIDGQAGAYELEKTVLSMLENCLGKTRNSKETIFNIEINDVDESRLSSGGFEVRYPGMELIDYPYKETNPKTVETNIQKPRISVDSVLNLYADVRDQRRQEYWYRLGKVKYALTGSDSVTSEYAFINKWREGIRQTNPEMIQDYSGLLAMEGNRVVWRLADLILLRAECRARLGLITAKDDLDRIRERAGTGEYTGSTDPEALRREIFRERERELFGEGQRYYDIVRNAYYREVLPGNFKTLTETDVENGALYLPVSPNAFIKNVYMQQNTYWLWQQ